MGYHLKEIPKGELGAFSKIKEEFLEAEDAVLQRDVVMTLVELSDMLGAIEAYIERWNLNIKDLKDFSDKTKSAFKDGTRS